MCRDPRRILERFSKHSRKILIWFGSLRNKWQQLGVAPGTPTDGPRCLGPRRHRRLLGPRHLGPRHLGPRHLGPRHHHRRHLGRRLHLLSRGLGRCRVRPRQLAPVRAPLQSLRLLIGDSSIHTTRLADQIVSIKSDWADFRQFHRFSVANFRVSVFQFGLIG